MFLLTDMIAMIGDINKRSTLFGWWGKILNIPHLIGGLIFINHTEAVLILITGVFSVAVAAQMHKRSPFSRLTSVVHVMWVPLFPYLVYSAIAHGWSDPFGIWLAFSTATIAISLILGARNLVLYLTADNKVFVSAP